MPALARAIDFSPALLQQQPANDTGSDPSNLIHQEQAPSAIQQSREGASMSSEQSPNSLKERLAEALRRRVGVGRGVTIKQLAYSIRVSEATAWNLLNGNNEPRGTVLLELIRFFDSAFANEIMAGTGATIVKLQDQRALDAVRKIAEGVEELKAMEGR